MKIRDLYSMLLMVLLIGSIPVYGQSIITTKEGYGIVSRGKQLLITDCQSITKIQPDLNLYIVQKNNRFGVFDLNLALDQNEYEVSFEFEFISEIHWRNGAAEFFVKKNGKFGAINSDGKLSLQLLFDTLFIADRRTRFTMAGLNKKWALVSNACTLEGSANLKFDYDEILPEVPHSEILTLRKGAHYAFASIYSNELLITQPMFDVPASMYQGFLVSSKNDTAYYMYSGSSFDKLKEFEFTMNLLNPSVLFNLSNNRSVLISCPPGISNILLVYPYIYFGLENPNTIQGIQMEHSYDLFRHGELNGECTTFKLGNPGWDSRTNVPRQLTFLKVRTPLIDGAALECVFNLNKNVREFSYKVEAGKTMTFNNYSASYLCANLLTLRNQRSKEIAYFKCDDKEGHYVTEKPVIPKPKESRGHGGGGGSSGWRGIFWIGGR